MLSIVFYMCDMLFIMVMNRNLILWFRLNGVGFIVCCRCVYRKFDMVVSMVV